MRADRVLCSDAGAAWRQGTYQAIRFAWGWMSRAVSPFTICITFTDSGIRGSKKRTSPLTLRRRPQSGLLWDQVHSWGPGDGGAGHVKCHAGKAKAM